MNTFYLLFSVVGLVSLYLYLRPSKQSSDTVRIPPGPKPLPLVGNIFDLTAKELWIKATSFAQTYGPVFQLSVLHPSLSISMPLIFLSSPEVCFDLLDKKGGMYSDKPKLVMAGELCGYGRIPNVLGTFDSLTFCFRCDNMVAFTGYGAQSKRQRKLMGLAFSKERIPAYKGLIEKETAGFLTGLISSYSSSSPSSESTMPARFHSYIPLIRRYAGQLTLSVVYGYTVPTPYTQIARDQFLGMAEDCVDILSNKIASGGGIWLVDIFPWLKRTPKSLESLSLFSFLPKSRVWKAKMVEFVEKPYEWVKTEMRKGTHKPSFCSTLLDVVSSTQPNLETRSDISTELLSSWATFAATNKSISSKENHAQFEFDLKWTANSMYSASADSTITTVIHYFLAIMEDADKGGEVVRKARKELDMVTGLGRSNCHVDRRPLLTLLSAPGDGDSLSAIKPRLPSLSDRFIDVEVADGKGGITKVKKPRFPYVEAIMSEVWRWGVVVPLSKTNILSQVLVANMCRTQTCLID